MFSQSRSTRDEIHSEFSAQFYVGQHFGAIRDFGNKFNVIFSIANSHPASGDFHCICKHGVERRILLKSPTTVEDSSKYIYIKSAQKLRCPAFIKLYNFTTTRYQMEHNHPIFQDFTTYAINRKQSPKIMERIYSILASGHKDPTLTAFGINNIITKDIQNIQTLFLKNEDGKEIHASSAKGTNRLQTFAVAAAFVNAETEAAYTWVLEELRNAIWPEEKNYELPNCSWHLWNTMEIKLSIGKVNAAEYRYRRCLAEEQFKAIVGSNKEQKYLVAVFKVEQIVTETDWFKDNGRSALIYLKEVLLEEDEKKHWVGFYANKFSHMGNRTSARTESFHSGLKKALGNQSVAKLAITTGRMHAYYQKKRDERYRKMGIERISIDANVFEKDMEYRYEKLKFKVVRFAMDKIRKNTNYSLRTGFVTRGENCNCADRINYKLSCPCVIAANSDVLPLEVVDKRWRLEFDENFDGSEDKYSLDKTVGEGRKRDDVVLVLTVSDEEKNNDCSFIPLADDEKFEQKQNGEVNSNIYKLEPVERRTDFSTKQQIADALTVLEEANDKILDTAIKIDQLKPPTTNSNRKGRPSAKGLKSGTKRLQIAKELLEEKERHVPLEQKKRKLTLVFQNKEEKAHATSIKNTLMKANKSINLNKKTPAEYDRILSYPNLKSDTVFKWIQVNPINSVAAIYSVGADGNCGFRAVSSDVYKTQSNWINVKEDMLNIYLKYKDSLYKAVGKEAVIVADTYERSVFFFVCGYTENVLKTGEVRTIYVSQVFIPLVHMESSARENPISLLLSSSHFYYVEFARTPKGRMKKFEKPVLNHDHKRLLNAHPDICKTD
ncbi:hypothetical protein INT47_009692 [Mucor saturninus]|uniref:Protein FAR1-RELATED SEQUENCE n=1 Tax=Mucor saturninus TaxID=64648 RepID=A0A8H7QIZ4_9FUNG|nr:hypothetical protein INT47_009692 [Mucor saturninus]